jgi:pheromone shutdown protein TraB
MNEEQLLEIINRKKKGKFSKKIVVSVIILNILFTAAIIWLFWQTGNEPSSLVVAWFGFTGLELWSLAGIKKKKEEHNG